MENKSAVEWLAIKLYEKMNMSGDGKVFNELLTQAKEMEADKIAKAYETGWVNGDLKKAPRFGSEYYSYTFKKEGV